ncbi:MAG: 7-carboxy-7-deazaguanine synthase QueE [Hyphomonadaceae bacterium]|nr:7-carboxy-7-deazaguanine synthase QueE [Hyphomonadaceae bacterium]
MSAILKLARNDQGEPEIFRSIQGEGPAIGRPRTFVRLSGCNLHCVWCDTAYTWNWVGTPFAHRDNAKFNLSAEMVSLSVKETAARIRALPSEGVVITGGEPLLQTGAVVELIDTLRLDDHRAWVDIETNGSIVPSQELVDRIDFFVVSPKLAHSGNEAALALKDEALRRFAQMTSASFKFVVKDAADVEAVAALAETYAFAKQRIYIMPEGTTSEALLARGPTLIDAVIAHGFNYSDRLHIHLFGQKRGV